MNWMQADVDDPETFELRWTWLPFFISVNRNLLRELENDLLLKYKNVKLTGDKLKEADLFIAHWFETKLTIPGLSDFLRGLTAIPEDFVCQSQR